MLSSRCSATFGVLLASCVARTASADPPPANPPPPDVAAPASGKLDAPESPAAAPRLAAPEAQPAKPLRVAAPEPPPPGAVRVAAPESVRAASKAPTRSARLDKERSMVNLVKIDLGAMYFRGDKMVGNGTLARFQGGGATARIQAMFFPGKWFGFEVDLHGALSSTRGISPLFGVEGAFDVAFQHANEKGKLALVFGAGGGVENNKDMAWFEEDVRGYPLLHTRFRFSLEEETFTQIELQVVPITTGNLVTRFMRAEIAHTIGWAMFGARCTFSTSAGGLPERTYQGIAPSAFFGAALW